jgi:hypothetical protein
LNSYEAGLLDKQEDDEGDEEAEGVVPPPGSLSLRTLD